MQATSVHVMTMTESDRTAADHVETAMFGADMLRFTNTTSFQQQALGIGATSVRWPGGIIVDPNPGIGGGGAARWIDYAPDGSIAGYVYDLTHDDIIDTDGWPREGLRRALDFAIDNDLGFQMVVPQNRYILVDPDAARPQDVFTLDLDRALSDLDVFLERLAAGHFGDVPQDFTLQFGQEYYLGIVQDMVVAHGLSHEDHMAAIGRLQSAMAGHIAQKVAALTAAGDNPQDIDPKIALHMGRIFGGADGSVQGSYADGALLAQQFDAAGLAAIDQLLIQRYVPAWAGLDDGFSEPINGRLLQDLVQVWDDAAAASGVSGGYDVLAGWAKSSLTRNEVRALWSGSVTEVEMANRSNRAFEEFYQDRLANYNDYGAKHASFLLQQFCEMVGAGVDAATYYGIDLGDAGQITGTTRTGEAVTFLAGTVFQRLAANTQGMALNGSYLANSRDATDATGAPQVNSHIFEDADRIVGYFSVNDIDETAGVEVSVSFGAGPLAAEFATAEGVSLKAADYAGWREAFGVIDLDARWGAGFQDAEAGLYAVALRDAAGNLPTTSYSLAGDALKLNFTADYEVIEVTLVRLHDGMTPDLIGTPGPDTLRAGRDGQSLRGLGGDDLLIGNAGVDLIRGDDGDDEIRGGGGNDELWGGNGDDRIQGQAGRDTVLGEEGNDRIWGGGGDDVIGGGGGTDRLFGSNGHDILNGDGGADILRGAKGNDILSGGARDDILDGGKGQDRLTGGAGADLFVFAPGDGSDEITDFSVADGDRIDLGQLALGLSFGEFRDQHLAQSGTGVTIQVDAGLSVLLTGVQIADLTAEAFLLA